MTEAWLYDGETAVRHPARVEAAPEGLHIRLEQSGELLSVPSKSLTYVESRRGFEVYGRRDVAGWRLGLEQADAAALAAVLPGRARYGRLIDRIGLLPAVAIAALLSGAVIFAGMRFPGWVAPHVPQSWEKKMGDTLVGDFGGRFCEGKGGEESLRKLAARLSHDASRLSIRVVPAGITNAVALPGGHIVIFDELLKESDDADELAGVLAHEIAHIEERHTTEAMIRELGLGLFISALGGGTGTTIESMLSARYSRGAESEADDLAVERLRRANVSPLGTARFFERLAREEAKLGGAATPLSYLSSHPLSADRQKKFVASAVKGRAYRPALDEEEWRALFNICFNDPQAAEKRLNFFL